MPSGDTANDNLTRGTSMGKKRAAKKTKHYQPAPRDEAVRPTPQRMARGSWTNPTGMDKHERPMHDAASDEIGRLWCAGKITDEQEQTARDVQAAWDDYRAELGVNMGRSCLDIGLAGYDAGDGNPAVIRRWKALTGRLNSWQHGALMHTVCMDHVAKNVPLLRDALNIAGLRGQ